jgi:rRNA maturation endonuclease Nob1
MNVEKMESLIMNGGKVCKGMSAHAYKWHVTGIGSTHPEIMKENAICQYCGTQISKKNMAQHQMTKNVNLVINHMSHLLNQYSQN